MDASAPFHNMFFSEKHIPSLWLKEMLPLPPSTLLHPLRESHNSRLKTGRLSLLPLTREITWCPGEWHEQGSPVVLGNLCHREVANLCPVEGELHLGQWLHLFRR